MKKGLILALMTVMAVAAVPVVAESPVILTLPIVVISNMEVEDQGVIATATGNPRSVFRYLNALDIEAQVDWRNATYANTEYRFFYSDVLDTSGISYQMGGLGEWLAPLTAVELSDLTDTALAGYGTEPAGKDVFQAADGMVNLLNFSAVTTSPLNPARPIDPYFTDTIIDAIGLDWNPSSSVTDTGFNFLQSWASAWPCSQTDLTGTPTELLVIAAVTSGSQVLPSEPETLEVYSLVNDVGGDRQETAYVYETTTPYGEWNRVPNPAVGTIVKPPTQADPVGKVGFTVDPTDNPAGLIIFASWNLGTDSTGTVFPLVGDAVTMTDKLYEAQVRLRSTAASASACPGYRVEFANRCYTSFGGVEVSTTDAANAPYLDNDFWVTLLWEVPFGCNDMGDTGTLADWPLAPGTDYRDYTLLFDLFHNQYGDSGVLGLEEVRVQVIDKPVVSTTPAAVAYDTDGYAAGDWSAALIGDGFFADGVIAQSATEFTITTGVHDALFGARFIGAFGPIGLTPGDLGGNLPFLNNRVLSYSCLAESVDEETTPIVRLYTMGQMSRPVGVWPDPIQSNRNIIFFTMFGALDPFAKLDIQNGRSIVSATQPNPGVPMEAGTVLTAWCYTHGGYDEAEDYMLPNIQVLSLNRYLAAGLSGWADDAGGVTISNVSAQYYD